MAGLFTTDRGALVSDDPTTVDGIQANTSTYGKGVAMTEPTQKEDEFAVRIVFETTDTGPDRDDAVRWVLRWIEAAIQEAPFHVERIHGYAVSDVVVLDV